MCLLELVDGNDKAIKMHDVIYDLALMIINNKGDEDTNGLFKMVRKRNLLSYKSHLTPKSYP